VLPSSRCERRNIEGSYRRFPDDFICLTADGLLVECRPEVGVGWETRSGPLLSEIRSGKHVSDLFPLAWRQTLMAGVQRCLDSKAPASAEFVLVRAMRPQYESSVYVLGATRTCWSLPQRDRAACSSGQARNRGSGWSPSVRWPRA